MLDDYKNVQTVAYKILKNTIKKNKYSHAYLFESNNFYDSFNFIMAFVKSLLCPNKYLNKNDCENCHQCEVIESGNFPEIKIINPDGLWIKKEQLRLLQSEFNQKALIGDKRIYIINQAEKLNQAASNSILKFLEEPEGNIIAILLTDNINEILDTIRSRCQIIRLKNITKKTDNKNEIEKIKNMLYLNRENSKEIMEDENTNQKIIKVIDFINYYEKNKKNTLLFMNKLWGEYIKNKEEMQDAFDIMIMYYKDVINIKLNKKTEIFNETNSLKEVARKHTLNQICNKLNILVKTKQKIKYNANMNLIMDKLIIDMEGGI